MGHAKDPITAGLSLEQFLPADYFASTGASLVILGAGGSGTALSWYLQDRPDHPEQITVTARRQASLDQLRAIHDARGTSPDAIDYVNPHATSTAAGDAAEAEAILSVFGDHARRGLAVSATKSMTGHLLGASGALEAVIAVTAIARGEIPPTINVERPEGAAAELDLVPGEARRERVRAALSNSTGFGGHNATLAFAAFE